MRWSTPSFAGATLRWRVALCLGLSIAFGELPGQTVEIWRAQSQNAPENSSQFGTIAVVDSKDVLSLQSDVVVANTTLLAQNEPLSPSEFNPDPGASQREQPETPEAPELFPPILPQLPEYGQEALPRSLQLPRKVCAKLFHAGKKLEYEIYPQPEAGEGLPPDSQPEPNRWFIGFGRWKRYADPSTETPYQSDLHLWHPYLQSKLKGDAPIIGQDIFLTSRPKISSQFEARKLPTPSGVSAAFPNSSEFFRTERSIVLRERFFDRDRSFKGETAFKPIDWALRVLGVYNHNYLDVEERNVVNPNPRMGTTRERNSIRSRKHSAKFTCAIVEQLRFHFRSRRHSTVRQRFRGFISNTPISVFAFSAITTTTAGNTTSPRFDMLEKDTYSDLNEFSRRAQQIYTATFSGRNLIWKGYTGELTFLADFDNNSRHYDKNVSSRDQRRSAP